MYIFLSCSPLPFFPFLSLFFLLFSLSFLPFLLFFSLSLPADFWCGDRRHAAPLPTGLPRPSCNRQTVKELENIVSPIRKWSILSWVGWMSTNLLMYIMINISLKRGKIFPQVQSFLMAKTWWVGRKMDGFNFWKMSYCSKTYYISFTSCVTNFQSHGDMM